MTSFIPHFVTFVSASGQHPRPAVSHQAAVHEVPEGTGDCGGRPAARHVAAHAQDAPLLHQDELPQRGLRTNSSLLSKSAILFLIFFLISSYMNLSRLCLSGDKVDRGEHGIQDGQKRH